jgi:SAM-dependent methyltransferase
LKKNKLKLFNIKLTILDLLFFYKQISLKKSLMRATHNLYLKKNINIKGNIADLGAGEHDAYYEYIGIDKNKIDRYDFYKVDRESNVLNLEKKFKLKKKYDHIILFNVLEHIYNSEDLISSINKNLKKKGKLEIFVPFMFRFHGDPNDFIRPTHSYLAKLLRKNGFKVKSTLIGAGQMAVILEILFQHLKINPIKFLIAVVFLIFNNFFNIFSKDFKNYYCGVHCSCVKINEKN